MKNKRPSELFEKASNGDSDARQKLWDKGMVQGNVMSLIELGVLQGIGSQRDLEEFLDEYGELEDDPDQLYELDSDSDFEQFGL